MSPSLSFVTAKAAAVRDHPYITSAKRLGGWLWKMTIFADVHLCIYADIMGGSGKVQKYADVI
jgi:hypothetical protein